MGIYGLTVESSHGTHVTVRQGDAVETVDDRITKMSVRINKHNVTEYFRPYRLLGHAGWECRKCGWQCAADGVPPGHDCPESGQEQETSGG